MKDWFNVIADGTGEPPRRHVEDEHLEFSSPMGKTLAGELVPRLAQTCEIRSQVLVDTSWESFTLAFLLTVGSRKIGVECDGDEGYTGNRGRDEFRDALILASGAADAVYRLPGSLVWHRPFDGLYVLSVLEPELFSHRERVNLKKLRTEQWERPEDDEYSEPPDVWLEIKEGNLSVNLIYSGVDVGHSSIFEITRSRLSVAPGRLTLLAKIAEFARQHPGKSVAELEKIWAQRQISSWPSSRL